MGILILSSLRIPPLAPAPRAELKIGKFGAGTDSDHYSSASSSPTSNLDPSSVPMDQLPAPASAQPEIPSVHTPDPASEAMDRLAAIEDSLESIQDALRQLLLSAQNLPPAHAPAALAPVLGPDFLAPHPAPKTVLRPNPPAVFDGNRTQGRTFLYSVLTYYQLVLEAFVADGFVLQEKLVRFTMSFMSKGAAARWAERHASADPFPFPTWTKFKAELCLRFVEENEQDQALTKLESHSYFQGSSQHLPVHGRLRGAGTVTAGYSDALVRVTKYRSGLDPKVNVAITTSGTAPDLTDYNSWRARTSGNTRPSPAPRPETLRLGFRLPFLGCAQQAYFRLWLRFPSKGSPSSVTWDAGHSLVFLGAQREDETVLHYLIYCPAHANARAELHCLGGRLSRDIDYSEAAIQAEALPAAIPLLFQFVAQSGRFRTVFGELPLLEEDACAR
ncbi:hypothetical protein B0H14DRAFT_3472776 [Mycena olivaceomarginata]|nr:hypothetical protein B0H14DRAFT_3472776 [Mycena olivaceomarginata]